MKIRHWVLAGLVAAAAAQAAPVDSPRGYAATAPVRPAGADGLQRLTLPLAVLQASRSDGYADVRLFDAAGAPLPLARAGIATPVEPPLRAQALPRFAWPEAAASKGTLRLDAAGPKIRIDAAGAVIRIDGAPALTGAAATAPQRWLLDASAAAAGDERWRSLRLDWAWVAGGVSTTVRVEASDDARQWRAVTQTALLELDADAAAPSQKTIEWPAGADRARYLRLSFDAPLALAAAELRLGGESAPAQRPSQRFDFAPDGANAWTLDLQGRVPLVQVQVHLPQPNSVAALRLEQRDDASAPWRSVSSFVAWRLVRDGVEAQATAQTFNAPPARWWRLVTDARTPLAAQPLAATLAWQPPQLVFAARDGQGLMLAVGRDKAASVALPIATLMPGHRLGDEHRLAEAGLGTLAPQAAAPAGLAERWQASSADDRRRWLLWLVLAAAVAGLGVLAWRLARDVGGARQPDAAGGERA